MLVAVALIAIPALVASLMRLPSVGWQPVMGLHIILAVIMWLTAIFRNRLPDQIVGGLIVGVWMLVAIGGFLNLGLSGAGMPFSILAVVFASVLFGTRAGLVVLATLGLTIAAVGWGYGSGALTPGLDFNVYVGLTSAWLTALFSLLLLGGGAMVAVAGLNKALLTAVGDLRDQSVKLESLVASRTTELETEIAERKRIEDSLRESEARYQTVVEDQTEMITRFTPDGIYTFVNGAYGRFVGRSPGELAGSSLYEDVPEAERETLRRYFASFTPDDSRKTSDNMNIRFDGVERHCEWSNTASFDENGNVVSFQSVGRDVTERRLAELARNESERRYRSLVDLSPDAIMVITDGPGTIAFANNSAARLFGLARSEDLIGTHYPDLIHPDYLELSQRRRQERREKGQVAFGEMEMLRPGGESFPCEIGSASITWENGPAALAILRDITERKEIDRMKTEFVSLVSHELRTPLTAIRGAISLTAGGAVGEVPERVHELLDIAKNNSERLNDIVNDILDFEKLQSGGMEFHFEQIEMLDVVRETMEANETYATQFGVKIRLDDAGGGPFIVRGDRSRLGQVLANLLSNAAKFSPEGGEILVAVARRNGEVRVEVADCGPGIPENYRDIIFDRFTQVNSKDTREVGGTGLGLSISKGIIDRHGGTIDFAARDGGGTEFFFTLPSIDAANPVTR